MDFRFLNGLKTNQNALEDFFSTQTHERISDAHVLTKFKPIVASSEHLSLILHRSAQFLNSNRTVHNVLSRKRLINNSENKDTEDSGACKVLHTGTPAF